ncbi:type II secretion system protein GspM [Massilia sp. TS11]|uniref:type II secretion system protein GspM n=1 Tax=Massilia sp. TS11 TaxID=2908003 RepID=UPI001EDB6871|nr:type II secretion system protein GspM [Massilia sp. TS11]MCG2585862.1 type II secretion system protein M [Massilia sp. TS11]
MMGQFTQYWEARSAQEKRLLLAAAAVVLLALVYSLLFEPAVRGRAQLQRDLPNLRQEAAQMQALAAEAIELQKRNAAAPAPVSKDSLAASLAARSLQPSNIVVSGEFIKLEFKGVAFANVHAWLDQLRRENMVLVQEASFVPQGPAGQVDVSLSLRQHQALGANPQ